MKDLFRQATFLIFPLFSWLNVKPQPVSEYPEIGKLCPDFTLMDVTYFSSKKASLADFSGKWLILDFWSRTCATCIKTFPKTNSLQLKFRDKVQFILVGIDDPYIRTLYERFRQKYDLHLAVAYDSVYWKHFGVPSVPHILWIDPSGIVRAITEGSAVNESNIKSFLNGYNPQLPEQDGTWKNKINSFLEANTHPFSDEDLSKDSNLLYRSNLEKWVKKWPVNNPRYFSTSSASNQVKVSGLPIDLLYLVAYGDTNSILPLENPKYYPNSYGVYWPDPILEVRDSSPFKYDFPKEQNLYCYNLIVSPGKFSKLEMQYIMQTELDNYFGFKARVEIRLMPCWNLVADDSAKYKLRTKGAVPSFEGDYLRGFNLINQPLFQLIRSLWAMNQSGPPFIDETGIHENIDISMDKGTFDFNEMLESLRKNGLNLIKSQKEMKVLIISD